MNNLRSLRVFQLSIIFMGLVACSSFIPGIESAEQRLGKTMLDGETVVYNSDLYDITIVGFKENFEIIYDPQEPPTLKQAGQKHSYRYLINGSYFEGSRVHAGWLSIFGTQHTPLKEDQQLTHLSVLDTSVGYIDFPGLDLWDSSMTSGTSIEFQTGPLVIYANTVDTLSINASINGNGSHLRTFLAYTEEDGMKYFIISRQIGPLADMGVHLLSLPLFAGRTLSVINLDGGSSTALYSQNHPELNFNVNKPLPILLGIK